jgi:hypothetical protein
MSQYKLKTSSDCLYNSLAISFVLIAIDYFAYKKPLILKFFNFNCI